MRSRARLGERTGFGERVGFGERTRLGLAVAGALAFGAAFGISACAVSVDAAPNQISVPSDVFPSDSDSDDSFATDETPLNSTSHPVFFIRDGELVETLRDLPAPVFLEGPLNNLLAGPSDVEASEGLESAIPVGTSLVDVQLLRDNTIALHLNEVFFEVQGEQRIRAIAQFVFTASALADNTQGVLFYSQGRAQFLPDGTGTIAQASLEGLNQPRALRLVDFANLVPGEAQDQEDQ